MGAAKSLGAGLAILLTACAGPPLTARPPAVIGVIQGLSADLARPRIDALRSGLEALGYREGRDFTLELRLLEGRGQDRAAELTSELIGKGAAVIVVGNPVAVDGALKASTTVPIVLAGVGTDPVGAGWISSLSHPGGNVTGISFQVPTVNGRRLQLMREIFPAASRLGVLEDATAGRTGGTARAEFEEAARSLGVGLQVITAKDLKEVEAALATFRSVGINAVNGVTGSFFPTQFSEIAKLASAARIGVSWGIAEGARAGGLLGLGPEQTDLYRRSAAFIDKILRGAKPGDLPVEQPQKLEVVVNMKTAQALGITLPTSILAQATEVIR